MEKEKATALKNLGTKIKALREDRGINAHELSRMLGKTKGYMWEIEAGKVNVGWWTLLEICDCLNISMKLLLEE